MVTKPFAFEGGKRSKQADEGISGIREKVDSLIMIPNERLLTMVSRDTSVQDAFKFADDVLRQGVQGISDIINIPGLINVDFADVKTVMANSGSAIMGIGRASGEKRAFEAAKMAIESPLLESTIEGASGLIINVTGGRDLSLIEVNEAASVIRENLNNDDENTIFGAVIDESLQGEIVVTVIATGFQLGGSFKKLTAGMSKKIETPVRTTYQATQQPIQPTQVLQQQSAQVINNQQPIVQSNPVPVVEPAPSLLDSLLQDPEVSPNVFQPVKPNIPDETEVELPHFMRDRDRWPKK